jgi:hypothetical protein
MNRPIPSLMRPLVLLSLACLAPLAACTGGGAGPGETTSVKVPVGDIPDDVSCGTDLDCPIGYACQGGACTAIDEDRDNDGYLDAVDCAPDAFDVHPAAAERCNNIDDDCDGDIDEGVRNACGVCGDIPVEICDLVDNDCDGLVDEDCVGGESGELEPNDGATNCQPIALPNEVGDTITLVGAYDPAGDMDSYCFFAREGTALLLDIDAQVDGSSADAVLSLYDGAGAPLPGGYNDYADGSDPRLEYTFAADGEVRLDTFHFYSDVGGADFTYTLRITAQALIDCADLDGDGISTCDGDCDDAQPLIFPGQTEVCDGVDNNCSGTTDDGCPELVHAEVEPNDTTVDCPLLTLPFTADGVIDVRKDKDTFCFFSPGDVEVAFDVDAAEPPFDSLLNSRLRIFALPDDELAKNDDAPDPETGWQDDDADSYLTYRFDNPGVYAIQVTDESLFAGGSRLTYRLLAYALDAVPCLDVDGDGVSVCEGDCDDTRASVHFGAAEVCDTLDNDCDGVVDRADCTGDFDGDGYAGIDGDCADDDPLRGPARVEVCDGVDNNCDGEIDEGVLNRCGGCGHEPAELCGNGIDDDCDGIVDDDCATDVDGDGVTPDQGDCDDDDANVLPGASEICDGVDNNCSGHVDEYVKNSCGLCAPEPLEICDGLDNNCNGLIDDGAVNACGVCGPAPVEVCDGVDNDCDGQVDEGLTNACGGCGRLPVEACDGVDNDCDNQIDEGCDVDLDADGVTPRDGDCNDGVAIVHHGASETCDGIDNDCDGWIDDGCTPPAETEPNDAIGSCDDLALPGRITGVVSNGPDADRYCIDIDVAGAVVLFDVDARDDGSPLDAHIELYGPDGALIAQNNDAISDPDTGLFTRDPALEHEFEQAGSYVVRVRAAGTGSTAGGAASYALEARGVGGCIDLDGDGIAQCDGDCDDANASIHPGAVDVCNGLDDDCSFGPDDRCVGSCLDDTMEPNDTAGAPVALMPGSWDDMALCGGDADWFGVDVPGGGDVTARIFFSNADANLSLELRGPDGVTVLDSSTSNANNEEVSATNLAAGTHFLYVYGPLGADANYQVELEVTP